ncbi:DapH/DapD/GlmU-related protein [Mucilaginibacter glaciei]|uniref:DapH/DapD/GlmU-related protein n=1 Tax=Mucilaginibacter glaciei TaxID=2772109 RepID=UPI001CD11D97|nr:DapH/DapD/GlmU-related protein [Mucilaginibacter glaciei]
MIRLPVDVRGKKFISFNKGFTTGKGCRFEAYPIDGKSKVLLFGTNIQVNDHVHITAMSSVVLGNNVLIASNVYISDSTHGSYAGDAADSDPLSIPKDRLYSVNSVTIGDNVWLGEKVSVLPGVTIGSGTIVGANAVVTKSLPANVIAVGIPAKPIKKYNFKTQRWEII